MLLQPIAVSLDGAAEITALSKSTIDIAIRGGELPVRHRGNRTLILVVDLQKWIDSMPAGRPAAPPQLAGRRQGRPPKSASVAPSRGGMGGAR